LKFGQDIKNLNMSLYYNYAYVLGMRIACKYALSELKITHKKLMSRSQLRDRLINATVINVLNEEIIKTEMEFAGLNFRINQLEYELGLIPGEQRD